MNQTELIARVRRNAFIRDNHPDYTDSVILDELNDGLRSIYLDIITGPRQGHWFKQYSFTSAAGQQTSRITPRAVVGGLEKVEIGEVGGDLFPIEEITENHAGWYESFAGRTGTPQYFVIRGDQIDFLPTFDHAMTVRVGYYVKPSVLVSPQSVPATYGRVVSKSLSAGLLRIDYTSAVTLPVIKTGLNAGSTPVTGTAWDIIHPDGTCELSAASIVVNGAGSGFTTFDPGGWDINDIQVGDFVRGAGETDWPALPEEFHRTVADVASVKIMLQLNMASKASQIASSVGGDLSRLRTLMATSRVRSGPKTIGLSMITMGTGRKFYPRFP